MGGLTWLGRKPTRDDPRCNRVLDLPVYKGTTRKDYGLGVHCKPAKDNPRYNRALEPLVYKYIIEMDYGLEVGALEEVIKGRAAKNKREKADIV